MAVPVRLRLGVGLSAGARLLGTGLGELGGCLLDFVFPPACWACGGPMARAADQLCAECWDSILAASRAPARCVRCGCPAPAPRSTCANCAGWSRAAPEDALAFERAVVLGPFDPAMQQAIHALKFRGCRKLAAVLGRRLGEELAAELEPVELLVPVPLHPARRRQRGYNQSAYIAGGLAQALRVPVAAGLLRRTVNTQQQARLGAGARRRNLAAAFRVVPPVPPSRCVAVVDDVMTTGSTVDACAQRLRQAGVERVWAVTVASRFRREALGWRQNSPVKSLRQARTGVSEALSGGPRGARPDGPDPGTRSLDPTR